MSPEDLGRFLTAFQRVTAAVHRHRGVIDKFIGDGAMIVFGVPEASADDAARALRCAEALLAGMESWSREREAQGRPPLRIGIGGHHGEVFIGAVGDETRLEYTILGDVVNTAQRLQELTRETSCALLASEKLLAAAGAPADRSWRAISDVLLRGRQQPVRVFARWTVRDLPRGGGYARLGGTLEIS